MKRINLCVLLSVIFVLLLIPVCISGVTPTTKITQNVTKVNLSAKNITLVNSSAKNTSANVSGPVYNMNLNTGQPAAFTIVGLLPQIQADTVKSTGGSGSENSFVRAPVDSTGGGTGTASSPASNVDPGASAWGKTGSAYTNTGLNTPSGWGATGSTNTNTGFGLANTGQNILPIAGGDQLPIVVHQPDPVQQNLMSAEMDLLCLDETSEKCRVANLCKTSNYASNDCEIFNKCIVMSDAESCDTIEKCYNSGTNADTGPCLKCASNPIDSCTVYCATEAGKKDTILCPDGDKLPTFAKVCEVAPTSKECGTYCEKYPDDNFCKLMKMNNDCKDPLNQNCIDFCKISANANYPMCKNPPEKSQETPVPTPKIVLTGPPSFIPGDFFVIYPGIKVSSGSISGSSGTGALPDLIITKIDGPVLAKSGSSITVPFTVKNQGKGKSGPFLIGFFVSTPIVRLESTVPIAGLNAGASYEDTAILKIPGTMKGNYYLGAYADIKNVVRETDENNNYFVRVAPISIT